MGSFGGAQAVSFSSGWTSKMGSFRNFNLPCAACAESTTYPKLASFRQMLLQQADRRWSVMNFTKRPQNRERTLAVPGQLTDNPHDRPSNRLQRIFKDTTRTGSGTWGSL
jgi:hypothetical protein